MALPNPAPITLSAIQTEFSAGSLTAASTAAGLDPLPTSMLDFLGLSNYAPQVRVNATSGSGTWTVPTGCTQIWVMVVGGGAGGGGAQAGTGFAGEAGGYSANAGGGGGAGAVATLSAFAVTPGQSVSYTVGAGGFGNRSGIPQAGQGMETRRPDNSLDPEKISTEETRWMTKKLKLTEEQLPKIEDVNIKYAFKRFDIFEEIKKITANGTVAPTEDFRIKIKEKMLKMKADKDKELKDILTPEQFELYQKKRTDK